MTREEELTHYLNNIDFENDDVVYNKIEKLFKENQELKKQFENAVADYETTMAEKVELERQLKELGGVDEYNRYLLNQQKEFIRWLDGNTRLAPEPKKGLLNEILQKYKEIIGVSDEKK